MQTEAVAGVGFALAMLGMFAHPSQDKGPEFMPNDQRAGAVAMFFALFALLMIFAGASGRAREGAVTFFVVLASAGFVLYRGANDMACESKDEGVRLARREGQAEALIGVGAALLLCAIAKAMFF